MLGPLVCQITGKNTKRRETRLQIISEWRNQESIFTLQTLWLIPPVLLQSGGTWFEACVDWKVTLPTPFPRNQVKPTYLFVMISRKLKFWMTPLSIKTHLQLFTVSPLAQLKRILSVISNTSPLPRSGRCCVLCLQKARPEQMEYPTVFPKRQVLLWSDTWLPCSTSLFGQVKCQMNGNAQ